MKGCAEEPPELFLVGPSLPRRLLLEGAERFQVALGVEDPFHRGRPERADQLVFQVCDADVETESFHVSACEVGAEACTLETTLEIGLLSDEAFRRVDAWLSARGLAVESEELELKGFDGTRRAYRLRAAVPTPGV